MTPFKFEIIHQSTRSRARIARIHTEHGIIDTPGFVAVGTNGTLKSIDNAILDDLGLQLMFCNTYHLLLQPGPDIIKKAGGLHKFIARNGPIITDSGGFQVFSLAYGSVAQELKSQGTKKASGSVLKITEEGVLFRSYRDGQKIRLTPESSVQTQKSLGADIIIPLDELPPYHIDPKELKKSLDRTHRWEKRSLEEHLRSPQNQAMYAVIHGGIDPTMRRHSCEVLSQEAFDGFAIGGSMGKTKEQMFTMLQEMKPYLPSEKPNHLLGIGDLESIEHCIPLGIDTFDSSYPTRAARHEVLFTKKGKIKITKACFSKQFTAIEEGCCCPTCQTHSAAYIHHLFKAKEASAMTLASIHNLYYMVQKMNSYREDILNDNI